MWLGGTSAGTRVSGATGAGAASPQRVAALTWHHVVGRVRLSRRVGHGQVPALLPLLPVTVTQPHGHRGHQ